MGEHVVDAELVRDSPGGDRLVAADQADIEPELLQPRDGDFRLGAQLVFEHQDRRRLAVHRERDDAAAAICVGADRPLQLISRRIAFVEQRRSPQEDAATSDLSADPEARQRFELLRILDPHVVLTSLAGHQTEHTRTGASVTTELAESVAQTMQVLATASRVRILAHLLERPHTVAELTEAVAMEQSAVSQQLRLLRHLGLVVGRRQGRNVLYALHDQHIGRLLDEAIGHVEHLQLGRTPAPQHPRASSAAAQGAQTAQAAGSRQP